MAEASGAHFNPAVSVGMLLGKRISIERFILYIVVQVHDGWPTTNMECTRKMH